ncbi:hypothetical protein KIH39_12315 [Telmatocola sphagniphila]|uniref:Uncharacterized protein n=1 Tax=Telmatocola sphagniphila TaxID=1123043 RepID=A0A8E6BCH7_9BACT|nr:hypothetical protein [Telmatocola sphagniphila]QVL34653.1 hypothetical protein KIH39_12315 [Telmatocola sphagniphila]
MRKQPKIPANNIGAIAPAYHWTADRIFFIIFAALLVARVQLPGMDPGRLSLKSGISEEVWGLLLIGFATMAAVGGAISGYGHRLMNWQGAALICVALFGLINALAFDTYHRPGLLHSADWFLAILLFLMARTLSENRTIQRNFLVTLVTVVLVQTVFEIYPLVASEFQMPTEMVKSFTGTSPLVGDDEFEAWRNLPENPALNWLGVEAGFLFAGCVLLRGRSKPGRLSVIAFLLLTTLLVVQIVRLFPMQPFEWLPFGQLRTPGHLPTLSGVSRGPITPLSTFGFAEFWGATGILGGLVFCWLVSRWLRVRLPVTPAELPGSNSFNWDMYVAGILGLLIGGILKAIDLPAEMPPDEYLRLGLFAMIKLGLWVIVYLVVQRIRFDSDSLVRALKFAISLLFVSIFLPGGYSVRWLMLLVFLGGLMSPFTSREKQAVAPILRWTRISVLLTALGIYFFTNLVPTGAIYLAIREARRASILLPGLTTDIKISTDVPQVDAIRKTDTFLISKILEPLSWAEKYDPHNASLMLEQARWGRIHWKYLLMIRDQEQAAKMTKKILGQTLAAIHEDPQNLAGYYSQLEALFLFIQESKTLRAERLKVIERNISHIVELRPSEEVALRYRLVMILALDHDSLAEEQALKLIRLNREEGQPHGSMNDDDRKKMIRLVLDNLKLSNQELLEEWIR